MSVLSMSAAEREAFLADLHVGVLGVAVEDGPPSLTPVWYRYESGVVEIVTTRVTRKIGLLRAAGTASLCAQKEEGTPAYVTVEGDVEITAVPDGVVEAIASRYLGAEGGAAYAADAGTTDDTLITLRPRTWRSADFSKLEQG